MSLWSLAVYTHSSSQRSRRRDEEGDGDNKRDERVVVVESGRGEEENEKEEKEEEEEEEEDDDEEGDARIFRRDDAEWSQSPVHELITLRLPCSFSSSFCASSPSLSRFHMLRSFGIEVGWE